MTKVVTHQTSKLLRQTPSLRKHKSFLQRLANLGAHRSRHVGLKHGWRDAVDADPKPRQVSRHGQRHGRDGALARGVADLPVLAVKGTRAADHDDDAALAVFADGLCLGDVRGGLADEVDGASEVHAENEVHVVEIEGVTIAVENLEFEFI